MDGGVVTRQKEGREDVVKGSPLGYSQRTQEELGPKPPQTWKVSQSTKGMNGERKAHEPRQEPPCSSETVLRLLQDFLKQHRRGTLPAPKLLL